MMLLQKTAQHKALQSFVLTTESMNLGPPTHWLHRIGGVLGAVVFMVLSDKLEHP